MRLRPGGAVKITAGTMGAVGSAVRGRVKYSWSATDTDTAGTYESEVQVTFANGKIRTFPSDGYFLVEITDDVG